MFLRLTHILGAQLVNRLKVIDNYTSLKLLCVELDASA